MINYHFLSSRLFYPMRLQTLWDEEQRYSSWVWVLPGGTWSLWRNIFRCLNSTWTVAWNDFLENPAFSRKAHLHNANHLSLHLCPFQIVPIFNESPQLASGLPWYTFCPLSAASSQTQTPSWTSGRFHASAQSPGLLHSTHCYVSLLRFQLNTLTLSEKVPTLTLGQVHPAIVSMTSLLHWSQFLGGYWFLWWCAVCLLLDPGPTAQKLCLSLLHPSAQQGAQHEGSTWSIAKTILIPKIKSILDLDELWRSWKPHLVRDEAGTQTQHVDF